MTCALLTMGTALKSKVSNVLPSATWRRPDAARCGGDHGRLSRVRRVPRASEKPTKPPCPHVRPDRPTSTSWQADAARRAAARCVRRRWHWSSSCHAPVGTALANGSKLVVKGERHQLHDHVGDGRRLWPELF